MGPLIFGEGLVALMLVVALITYYGMRKTAKSSSMAGVFLGVMYLMSFIFTGVGLAPLVDVPLMPVIILAPLVSIGFLIYISRKRTNPSIKGTKRRQSVGASAAYTITRATRRCSSRSAMASAVR